MILHKEEEQLKFQTKSMYIDNALKIYKVYQIN